MQRWQWLGLGGSSAHGEEPGLRCVLETPLPGDWEKEDLTEALLWALAW